MMLLGGLWGQTGGAQERGGSPEAGQGGKAAFSMREWGRAVLEGGGGLNPSHHHHPPRGGREGLKKATLGFFGGSQPFPGGGKEGGGSAFPSFQVNYHSFRGGNTI